jgi:signal transduction histidine kinase
MGIKSKIMEERITRKTPNQQVNMLPGREVEKLDDDLHTFFYHTSHNLKGPVSRLKGLIELLLLDDNAQGGKTYAYRLDTEVKQMENMLRKLQTINDVLSEDQPVTECDLGKLINQVLSKYQKSVIEKNIFVRIYADQQVLFHTHSAHLSIILENLIENAIQYASTDDTQSYLEIVVNKKGNELMLCIEDNGSGIRKASLERVFDMFYRDSPQSNGGGLGLYIVKEAAKKIHASLSLESEEGCYSKFLLKIPEMSIPQFTQESEETKQAVQRV